MSLVCPGSPRCLFAFFLPVPPRVWGSDPRDPLTPTKGVIRGYAFIGQTSGPPVLHVHAPFLKKGMLENASLKAAIATGTASELESALKNASANKSVDASVLREAVLTLAKLEISRRGLAASAPAAAEASFKPVGPSKETSLRDWLSKLLDCRILDRTHETLEREEVFSVADLAMFCALPRFNECLTALTREKMLNALKDEGLISSTAPAPSSPPGPDDSTPDWLAEASGVLLEKPEGNFCSQDRPRMAATTPIADHYATLGVARESIDEGIRLAYLDRARQTHPEKTTDASANAFNEVHEARDALQHRRATFDREQQAAEEGARQRQAVRLAPVKKAAEASARASRRRDVVDVEPEVAAELRCRSAEIASELELAAEIASKLELAAEIASELELAQAASRHATTQRPAAAPVSARETGYYITATGGGECYHLTPRCSGLLKAGVMRVVSTDGRRLCKTCDRVNAKPLIQASEQISVLRSARHVYYTTRTGKKYHTDRCCSGLSNAVNIIEVPCRPELEACKFCSRIF